MAYSSLTPWIEDDALKKLSGEIQEVDDDEDDDGPKTTRVARITSLGSGWTTAGINLTMGRNNTPYPSMTITDGKHEIVAYLISDVAQSSALYTRPPLSKGSYIQLSKIEFTPEPVQRGGCNSNDDGSVTPGVTFAMTVSGRVKIHSVPPIMNLNYSRAFSLAVGEWMVRRMDETDYGQQQQQQPAAAAPSPPPKRQAKLPFSRNKQKKRKRDDDDNSSSTDDDDNSSSTDSDDDDADAADDDENDDQRASSCKITTTATTTKTKNKIVLHRKSKKQKRLILTFAEKLEQLKAYREENGHCNAPPSYKRGHFALGTWINHLRRDRDTIKKSRKKALNELGMIWDLNEYNFNKNLDVLKQYKDDHGTTSVGISVKYEGCNLGTWVYNQRQAYKAGKMKPDRKAKLDQIEFDFEPKRRGSSTSSRDTHQYY